MDNHKSPFELTTVQVGTKTVYIDTDTHETIVVDRFQGPTSVGVPDGNLYIDTSTNESVLVKSEPESSDSDETKAVTV
jgi:hypothetical protein